MLVIAVPRWLAQRLSGTRLKTPCGNTSIIEQIKLLAAASDPNTPMNTIKIADYPQLQSICWNYDPAIELREADALALYERRWVYVDQDAMTADERAFLDRLVQEHGHGVFCPL